MFGRLFEGLVASLLVTLFVCLLVCLLVCLFNCLFVHLLVNDVSVNRHCMYHAILYQLESNPSSSASVTEIGEMTIQS